MLLTLTSYFVFRSQWMSDEPRMRIVLTTSGLAVAHNVWLPSILSVSFSLLITVWQYVDQF